MWIAWRKFSRLSEEYLSWAVSVLRNSPNIWDFAQRDVFQLIFRRKKMKQLGKSAVGHISAVFGTR